MYPIYIKDVINVLDIVTLNFLQKKIKIKKEKKKKNVTLNKGLKKKNYNVDYTLQVHNTF